MLSTAESGSDAPRTGSKAASRAARRGSSRRCSRSSSSLSVPSLGADPWPFRTGPLAPHGILGPLVRAADWHWDVGAVRSAAAVAGLVVLLFAGLLVSRGRVRRSVAVAATAEITLCLLIFPSVLLQAGLRDASARRGSMTTTRPTRSSWRAALSATATTRTAMTIRAQGWRVFTASTAVSPQTGDRRQPALEHFASFPGVALAAAASGVCSRRRSTTFASSTPLATLGLCGAALLFSRAARPAPEQEWSRPRREPSCHTSRVVRHRGRAEPSLPRAGVLFRPQIALRRGRGSAGCGDPLFKQFALVAVPFLAVALVVLASREQAIRAVVAAFTAVLAAGILPFLLADPAAMWSDTISYGTGTCTHHGLWPGVAPPARGHRVELDRLLPVRLACAAGLGADHRGTGARRVARADARIRSHGLRHLDVHAAVHLARVRDVVHDLAADGDRPRRAAIGRCGSGDLG